MRCWKERDYCWGSRLGTSRGRRVITEEVDDKRTWKKQQQKTANNSRTGCFGRPPGRPPAQAGDRSTGAVDRCAQRAQGGNSVDRPVDRLKVPNSLLGTRSTGWSTGGRGRSTARSTDSRLRVNFAVLETCLYKYGISRVFMDARKSGALFRSEVLLVL